MCTHSHILIVALFSLLSHNHIIKKLAVSATLFHTSFHSHSHISLLFFLIHTISLLLSVSYVGAEASDKSKLPMVLPRDVLVLSPSG